MINGVQASMHSTIITPEEKKEWPPGSCKEGNVYDFQYYPRNDGYYPCRIYGQPEPVFPYRGSCFSYNVPRERKGLQLDFQSAEKFYSPEYTPEQRCHFYNSLMEVRTFTEGDISAGISEARRYAELRLVGQHSVFANEDILAGQAIGIYAGEGVVSDNHHRFSQKDREVYGVELHVRTHHKFITGKLVGDGTLSRVNSIFEYEETRGWYEAKSGYNVILASVSVISEEGEHILWPCFFAIVNIKAGEEMRVEYGYPDEVVNRMMTRED
ncbi:hypothetical protein [Pantoea cypripedii]|uniref:hypothetical protein n=1 Tax=Pantoea cypripedii TaxID=55209 RepID=UPI001ABF6696|nr:hypothetical protein [Pantoea cypripedii]